MQLVLRKYPEKTLIFGSSVTNEELPRWRVPAYRAVHNLESQRLKFPVT